MLINLKEVRGIVGKLTFKKIWNIILLKTSFYLSNISKKVLHLGYPFAISIEPTTSCNLRCPECPSGLRSFSRPTGMLDFDFYKNIIDQCSPFLSYLILYFQGEPYLNPDFFRFIKYASEKKIYSITSTNAHFLNDEQARLTVASGLDKIIISIDGTTQETYEKYRIGGTYTKVIEGIQNLVYWKKQLKKRNPLIVLQFLILKFNQHQVNEIKLLSKELKVDQLVFKTAQIYSFEKGSNLIPDVPKYSRYKKVNTDYVITNKLNNRCWRMWSSSVITWDGKTVPCCFDKDAKYVLGDLKKNPFLEIWNNSHQLSFRQKILRSRKEIDICKNCSEGSKIWAE
jgi:radical SAM protein with 4Fe4S-binding SPASM domain